MLIQRCIAAGMIKLTEILLLSSLKLFGFLPLVDRVHIIQELIVHDDIISVIQTLLTPFFVFVLFLFSYAPVEYFLSYL